MSAGLPDEVVQWMAQTLGLPSYRVDGLKSGGVDRLKAYEIKQLLNAMSLLPSMYRVGRGLSGMRKADLQERLINILYQDRLTGTLDPEVVRAITASLQSAGTATNATTAMNIVAINVARAAAAFRNTAAAASSFPSPVLLQNNNNNNQYRNNNSINNNNNNIQRFGSASTMPLPFRQSFSLQQQRTPTTTAACAATSRPYIKDEHALPADDVPRNDHERQIMSSLIQIGFVHKSEIMISIRKLIDQHKLPLSTDAVMMDMIQAREEAEEARKMDEARRASEQTRHAERKMRQRALEEQMETSLRQATVEEWKRQSNMFAQSWILRDEVCCRAIRENAHNGELKRKVIDLLKLEKQTRKWFRDLPSAYFVKVLVPAFHTAINTTTTTTTTTGLDTWLTHQLDTLRTAMYTLSEQTKTGVPIVFIQAHDEFGAQISQAGKNDVDDDDVCIVLPTVSTATSPSASQLTVTTNSVGTTTTTQSAAPTLPSDPTLAAVARPAEPSNNDATTTNNTSTTTQHNQQPPVILLCSSNESSEEEVENKLSSDSLPPSRLPAESDIIVILD